MLTDANTFLFVGNLEVVIVITLNGKRRSITGFGCLESWVSLCSAFRTYSAFQTIRFWSFNMMNLPFCFSWVFGNIFCKMYDFAVSVRHTGSTVILVVICVERYMSIVHPFQCRRIMTIQRFRVRWKFLILKNVCLSFLGNIAVESSFWDVLLKLIGGCALSNVIAEKFNLP